MPLNEYGEKLDSNGYAPSILHDKPVCLICGKRVRELLNLGLHLLNGFLALHGLVHPVFFLAGVNIPLHGEFIHPAGIDRAGKSAAGKKADCTGQRHDRTKLHFNLQSEPLPRRAVPGASNSQPGHPVQPE